MRTPQIVAFDVESQIARSDPAANFQKALPLSGPPRPSAIGDVESAIFRIG